MPSGTSYVLPPPAGEVGRGALGVLVAAGRNGLRMLTNCAAEVGKNIESVIETFANALGTFPLRSPHLPPPARRREDDLGRGLCSGQALCDQLQDVGYA